MSNVIYVVPTPTAANNVGAWAQPVTRTPRFNTITQSTAAYRGQTRISLAPYPVWDIEIDTAYFTGSEALTSSYQSLLSLFGQMKGSADDFLMSIPGDNTISTPVLFGIGDGATVAFQLTRPIGGFTDIIQNLNGTPSIFVNGSQQFQNLLKWATDFTNAAWTASATVTPNTTTAPDGTVSADTLNDASATVFQSAAQVINIPADTATYTFSIFVLKTSGATNTFGFNVALSGGTPTSITPRLNTNSGVGGIGAVVSSAGAYWRVSGTITNNGTNTSLTVFIQPATGTNSGSNPGADSAATTGSAVVWGAQLESGSVVNPFVPTTSSPASPAWSINSNGIVTFASAPAVNALLTWSGSFYYRVHFADDSLQLQFIGNNVFTVSTLKFESVILP